LQGLYFFENDYDIETIRRNFDFYEPRTLHESSLSPCLHSIIAAKTGDIGKAYELYLQTSRLDLDDYNNEVSDGLHITSMGGTWMSLVYGFGGLRVLDDRLHLNPCLPENWESVSFKIIFRGNNLGIKISSNTIELFNESGPVIDIYVNNRKIRLKNQIHINLEQSDA